MELILGLIVTLGMPSCAGVYYLVTYYWFESQVEKEEVNYQSSIDNLIKKARIAGLIGGFGGCAILIPST